MEEVIAQRERGLIVTQIIVLVFLAVFVGVLVWTATGFGADLWYVPAIIGVIAVVFAAFSVRTLVQVSRLPKIIAVREGNELVFLGERVGFSAIESVDYHNARSRNGMQSWGRLTIVTGDGRTLSCDYVSRVNRVHDRIMQLKYEYAAKEQG